MSDTLSSRLGEFIATNRRLTILAGAGCSTASGIPGYRDEEGNWKHTQPVQYADFIRHEHTRQRYWARSLIGWNRISSALPNQAHFALAELEDRGYVELLVTQNVDNLHRKAGSRSVVDLHGVLDQVRCLDCDAITLRADHQRRLAILNPGWGLEAAPAAPDGDARLSRSDFELFIVPECSNCGGVLKPDVVFFGESVPPCRVRSATDALLRSDALLIVGSSLMVFSGYRFARLANEAGKPVAIVNRGVTRADGIATLKCPADCSELLADVVQQLAA